VEVFEAVGAENALLPAFVGVQNQDVILVVTHIRGFVREIRHRVLRLIVLKREKNLYQ
jgi:hypothetical protein